MKGTLKGLRHDVLGLPLGRIDLLRQSLETVTGQPILDASFV